MLSDSPNQFAFVQNGTQTAAVTVCISLYNYESYIVETLDSVRLQTHSLLDLIVVEDRSTDGSLAVAERWLTANAERFNRIALIQHDQNQGLAAARNTAVAQSQTPYVFMLDADNLLYPRCVERCLEALSAADAAAVAYPIIEKFGEEVGLMGNVVWNRDRFKRQNCIDAMSLIKKEALVTVEGYSTMSVTGWEDYQLWCKFIDAGLYGVSVPEILARYRTHAASMINTVSNRQGNIEKLHREMKRYHPWLEMPVG